ncbi:MAG TPA: nickel transporter [Burkholderiales bacterium]|nr:nickel transporter [Burkholderiales bacterium]
MEALPNDWMTLLALVFTLGLKHGLDADHLVAIDGLTRFNAVARPSIARWCGTLFSLGHGAVVVAVALAVGAMAQTWEVPVWIADLGAWISILFLLGLGLLNLRAVVAAAPHEMVQPVGLKGGLLGRLARTSHPLLIALVGSLFAVSFDTMSQAALFAVTATQFGGWGHSLALGLAFMLGMLAADGANGLWISRLIRRADHRARVASRVFSLVVSGLSLALAGFGVAKYFSHALDAWIEGKELAIGLAIIGFLALSFLFAMRQARMSGPVPARVLTRP